MKVFFILKWKNCAETIKKPIRRDETNTKDGNQTPVTSKVDSAILLTPTKFLVKSLNPKLLNSIITLWYLKTHTKATESAIDTCAKFIKSSISYIFKANLSLYYEILHEKFIYIFWPL